MSSNPFAQSQQPDPFKQQQQPYPPNTGQQQGYQQGQQGQGQQGQQYANPIPTPSRTQPIQPIGMTASVDGMVDRLCWAGESGGLKDATKSTNPPEMPDLSTPEAAVGYLKDNPSALWYMSKAEIIAMLLGPDVAAKYAAGERPEAQPDLPTVPKDQHRASLQGPAMQQPGQQPPYYNP
jgi:hypothetical protein